MSEANRTLVRRFFDEVCNGRALNVADELFSSNHLYHDPSSPWVGVGPQGMKELIGQYQRSFPDARWEVDETLESGETIVTRWTGTGTHKGDLMGLAPTNKRVMVPGIWIHRILGGKIVESWNVWDMLGMMQQLGIVQPLGRAARRSAG